MSRVYCNLRSTFPPATVVSFVCVPVAYFPSVCERERERKLEKESALTAGWDSVNKKILCQSSILSVATWHCRPGTSR